MSERIAKPSADAPLYRKGQVVLPAAAKAAAAAAKAAAAQKRAASANVLPALPAVNAWQKPLVQASPPPAAGGQQGLPPPPPPPPPKQEQQQQQQAVQPGAQAEPAASLPSGHDAAADLEAALAAAAAAAEEVLLQSLPASDGAAELQQAGGEVGEADTETLPAQLAALAAANRQLSSRCSWRGRPADWGPA